MNQPDGAGVTIGASANDAISITITEIAMAPTKSPAVQAIEPWALEASAIVTIAAKSGIARHLTVACTASIGHAPEFNRRLTSSVIMMPASTRRLSATIRPVTDIRWIEIPMPRSTAIDISVASGRMMATIRAERQPTVSKRGSTTRPTPGEGLQDSRQPFRYVRALVE